MSDGLNAEQVRNLVKYIIDSIKDKEPLGTYRYLIYHYIGIDYCEGMDLGLLDLNNSLCQWDKSDSLIYYKEDNKFYGKWEIDCGFLGG